jgi:hypothetical protein
MKLLFGLIAALAVTIAWQTALLSEENQQQAPKQSTQQTPASTTPEALARSR